VTGWQYITVIPLEEIMSQVYDVRDNMVISIIIILLIGSIAIYYMMYMNYIPINKLKSYSDSFLKNNQSRNEIESIHKAIEYLSFQNKDLAIRLKKSKLAAKEALLLETLKGRINSQDEFNLRSEDTGITFTKSFYSVVIFYINGIKNLEGIIQKEHITKELEQLLSSDIEGYGIDYIDPNIIILLVSVENNNRNYIENSLVNIQNYFKNTRNLLFTIGVGSRYNNIAYFPKSYMEAVTSINYRFVKGNDRVIFFDEIIHDAYVPDTYPHKELEKLKFSIKQSDTQGIEDSINSIIVQIKENNSPLFIAQGICFDIINAVITSTDEINKELTLDNKDLLDVFSLMEFETVEELSEKIKKVCFDACTLVKEISNSNKEDLTKQLISYIKENYAQYDFSINNVLRVKS